MTTMTDDEIERLDILVSEVDRPMKPSLPRHATGIMLPVPDFVLIDNDDNE
jgi:hypothetical protein